MSYPRKLTLEGQQEIERTAITRDELLSDKELAIKHRISVDRVQQIMRNARDKLRKPVGSTQNQHLTEMEINALILRYGGTP